MTPAPLPILDLGKPIKAGTRTLIPESVLGRGGSGEVYYVQEGNRRLALKLFFPFYKVQQRPLITDLEDDEIKYELSLQAREYEFLSRISHPNIVKVIENGFVQIPKNYSKRIPIKNVERLPYLITEYTDGVPLNDALVRYDLSPNQISQIFERVAEALQHGKAALITELPASCTANYVARNTLSGSERRNAVVSIPLVQNIRQVIFRSVDLAHIPENGNCLHLCYTDGAIQALENVVMTRYWNFRSMYWHHTNRALMAMVLHVVREIFITNKRPTDWTEYLRGTMWLDDIGSVRWLNERYKEIFHKESILHGIAEDRNRLFRRLYTVRVGQGAERDSELYKKLSKLGLTGEKAFRANLANKLNDFISRELQQGVGDPITADEVLIDIPRRDMDSGGHVYVKTASGSVKLLEEISRPVAAINENYQMLAKRVRIFISPRVAIAVDKVVRAEKRELIGRWLFELLKGESEGEVR